MSSRPSRFALSAALVVALVPLGLSGVLSLAGCTGGPPHHPDGDAMPDGSAPGNGNASGNPDSVSESKGPEIDKAEAALGKNDFAGVKQWAGEAAQKNPKNPMAYYYLGVAEEGLGHDDEAMKQYQQALKLAPKFAPSAVNLAGLLIKSKKYADAVAILKPLSAKIEDDPQIFQNLGVALAGLDDHAGSGDAFLKAISLGVNDPLVRLDCAEQLILSKRGADAAKVLKAGMSSIPPDAQADYALLLMKSGATAECVTVATKLVDAKGTADALILRGRCRRQTNDYEGARADLEAAIKKSGTTPEPYVYLGDVLEKLKKPAEAKKAYEKALSLKAAATLDDAPKLLKFAETRLAELH